MAEHAARGSHRDLPPLAHRLDRGPGGARRVGWWTEPAARRSADLCEVANVAASMGTSPGAHAAEAGPGGGPPAGLSGGSGTAGAGGGGGSGCGAGGGSGSGAGGGSKGGRPPLPEHLRRRHRVHVSVSDEERHALAAQARERGEAPLSFVRERMLERLAGHRLLPVLEDTDLEELRARTSELNRAVHQLHVLAADQPGPLDVDAIATQVADVLPALARSLEGARARLQSKAAAGGAS